MKIVEKAASACKAPRTAATKSACAAALQSIQSGTNPIEKTSTIVTAFKALLTQDEGLMGLGLDGFDWLFAHCSFKSTTTDEADALNKLATDSADAVVATPCLSDDVRIRVVRTLLTALSTSTADISRQTVRRVLGLLLEFSLAPALHLRTTSRAALAQIIGVLQQRAEANSADGDGVADVVTAVSSLTASATGTIESEVHSLALTLLHNLVVASPSSALFDHPAIARALCDVFPFITVCCTTINPAIHRPSFAILRHFWEHLRETYLRVLGHMLPTVIIPIANAPWSTVAQKEECIKLLNFIVSHPPMIYDLFSVFDCAVGQPLLVSAVLSGVSKSVVILDDLLRLQSLDIFHNFLKSLHAMILAQKQRESTSHQDSPAAVVSRCDDHVTWLQTRFQRASIGAPEAMTRKRHLQRLVEVFAGNHKDGVAAAAAQGLCIKDDADSVAHFLRTTAGLDKDRIGQYIGGSSEFYKKVMAAFIAQHDFQGLPIDEGLRFLLGHFKPIGEAEVIDRTMSSFAECYRRDNTTAFASHDAAHVMAFSIMMINTDLHSVNVKDKMTLNGFVSMLRGVNDGADFDRKFLESVFDRIKSREIKLKDQEAPPPSRPQEESDVFVSDRKKRDLLVRYEGEVLASKIQRQCIPRSAKDVRERQLVHDVVPELWEGTWSASLAAFSVCADSANPEPQLLESCLLGFHESLFVAVRLPPSAQRDAFARTLASMTKASLVNLAPATTASGARPSQVATQPLFTLKNAKALDVIVRFASEDGMFLGPVWPTFVACFSAFDKHSRNGHLAADVQSIVSDSIVETVFARNAHLPPPALGDFIAACLGASAQELLTPPNPRHYCLEKVLSTIDANRDRINEVWPTIWPPLCNHLVTMASVQHADVPTLMIEQLRQLSHRLLAASTGSDHRPLTNDQQGDMLVPFALVAGRVRVASVCDHVIASVDQIISSHGACLSERSWVNIMAALQHCSSSSNPQLLERSFKTTALTAKHAQDAHASLKRLGDTMHLVTSFCLNAYHETTAASAVELLVEMVVNDMETTRTSPHKDESQRLLLCGIANIVAAFNASFKIVQQRASLTTVSIFRTLAKRASTDPRFTKEFLHLVFGGVLCPVFDNLLAAADELEMKGSSTDAVCELMVTMLRLTEDVLLTQFDVASFSFGELLGSVLKVARAVTATSEVAGVANTVLNNTFLSGCAGQMGEREWEILCRSICAELTDHQPPGVDHASAVSITSAQTAFVERLTESVSSAMIAADGSRRPCPLWDRAGSLLNSLWGALFQVQSSLSDLGSIAGVDAHGHQLIRAEKAIFTCAISLLLTDLSDTPQLVSAAGQLHQWFATLSFRYMQLSEQIRASIVGRSKVDEAQALGDGLVVALGQICRHLQKPRPHCVLFSQLRDPLCNLIRSCDTKIAGVLSDVFKLATSTT